MPGGSERKLLTVLFADVVGATSLGEQLDVEPLREVFEYVFSVLQEEATRTGGVCQLLGDAVMALYGVPVTHEDDVNRALASALAMFERLVEVNARTESVYGAHVDLRIGVNTGEVMVPTGDPVELGGLHGDMLNVAARLQEAADAGTVLVGERAARASRSFRFEDRGMISVRGRHEPVRGYRLIGADVGLGSSDPLIRAPLIGRAVDLEVLDGAWGSAIDSGRPVRVTVVGGAGVGKSRLVAEFADRVGAQGRTLKGRCLPFGEQLVLRPLADVWLEQIGALEGDPPDVVQERTVELLRRLVIDARTRSEAETGFAYLLGRVEPETPPRVVARRILSGWRAALEGLSSLGPVLFLMEDLHWADPSLVEFLDRLAASVPGPVLFLATSRPSLFDLPSRPPAGTLLEIAPLDPDDAESLLGALVDESPLPTDLRNEVLSKAEGNPLFLEEILRHLVDEGSLVRTERGWSTERESGDLRIPDSIQAVLSSRIDRLEPEEKTVLQAAAVVGRDFWLGAVAAMIERPLDEVAELVEEIEARALVHARSSGQAGTESYSFNHVLTRDVAYASLPRRSRSLLHDRVVSWLDSAIDVSRPGLIAHHAVRSFEEAGHVLSLGADDQERLRKRAFAALLRASAASRTGNSIETAKAQARRAAVLVAAPAERARVEEALGEAAYFNYEGDEAWLHLRRAIALLKESGTSTPMELAKLASRALETPLRRPGIMVHHPPEEQIFEDLTRALEWAGGNDSPERARLLMLESFWRHAYPASLDRSPFVSDLQALEAGEESAAMARRLGRSDIESAALDGVSANHIPDSNYAEAWKATHRRLDIIDEIDDPEETGDILAMQCWIDFHRGHYREVFEFGQAGFDHTIDQVPSVALHCLAWRGMSRFRLGDWDGVLDDLRIGASILGEDRSEPPYFASGLWAVGAVVHDRRGDVAAADVIMEILAASQPVELGADPAPLASWMEFLAPLFARRGQVELALRLLATSSFRRGTRRGLLYQAECDTLVEAKRWTGARDLAEEARGFGESRGLDAVVPAADRLEGAALIAGSDPARGIELLRRSSEAFAALGARFDVALTEARLADALRQSGRPDDRMDRRVAAEFEQLGLVGGGGDEG